VAINEVLQRKRHAAPLKAETAEYFLRNGPRDILGPVGIGVEHYHAQRIAVLPGHQIGNGGFIVGAVEIGLRERRTEPAIAVDDDIEVFGRTRNNRGPITHRQLPLLQPQAIGPG
jgi:hypothetical protein